MSKLLVDPIDLHKQMRSGKLEVASTDQSTVMDDPLVSGSHIDLQWLRFAAREYQISPNIQDYVLVPVIIVPVGYPNRNGLGFDLNNLVSFNPDSGQQYYKSWQGKPTFYEHQNKDITKANGVILDVFLRKANRGNYWKILVYLAFDRSKYVDLIRRVITMDVNSYSMGAYVEGGYVCSVCARALGNCLHTINRKGPRINLIDTGGDRPQLSYRVGLNPRGFETSIVETPAWTVASSDYPHLIDPNAEYI